MAELNKGIASIEKGSVLEAMYIRLLAGMEEASHETLPDFTSSDYVTVNEDGTSTADEAKINAELKDYTDITRKNAAYMLANAIVTSVGTSGPGGVSGSYVSLLGDSMMGKLNTLYGFTSGDNGITILKVYQTTEEDPAERTNIVSIDGQLHLDGDGLYLNGWNAIRHDNDTLTLDSTTIALEGDVTCSGTITLGDLTISKDGINFQGLEFYHSGNSNREEVDWTMKDANVFGNLTVEGTSTLKSTVTALNGVDLGFSDQSVFSISSERLARLNGDLDILSGGIKFDGDYIIHIKNMNVVSFSAPGKILNLGDDGTKKIALQSGVYDDDGEYELITKFGSAYFPESFKAGHGLGNLLISTYKITKENSGVIMHRYLRFKNENGIGFHSDGDLLWFEAPFHRSTVVEGETFRLTEMYNTSFGYQLSNSLYAPANRDSASFVINTDADFYEFNKPLEGKISIGIAKSKTRILENQLFFNDNIYLLAIADGIKHYGNAYMTGDIGSVTFSSGFAGSGWKIYKNELTGNICATFDELTVRKKMRIYELEVQKNSAVNGSFWVSDSCSGDFVEEIL